MFVFLLLALSLKASALQTVGWAQLAERMTGESDRVREHSLSELKSIPNLDDLLKAELQKPTQTSRTRMYLALDVISALKRQALLPDLIELSETEPSGYLYHTINTLVTPQNRKTMTELYRSRILSAQTPPAAQMALLDTLARLGAVIKVSDLSKLMTNSESGVKKAALSYARTFLIQKTHVEYIPLVKDQLRQGSFLLRVQALFLLRELQAKHLPVGSWQSECRGDASDVIRSLCNGKGRS